MVYMWQHFWYNLNFNQKTKKKDLDTITNSYAMILINVKIDEVVIEFGIT
jgi:hypothetical protein